MTSIPPELPRVYDARLERNGVAEVHRQAGVYRSSPELVVRPRHSLPCSFNLIALLLLGVVLLGIHAQQGRFHLLPHSL